MSKEAMKLALEALGWTDEWRPQGLREEAITALREALANEALDRMAENARELGLDYEVLRPYRKLQDNGSKYFGESWDEAEQPAQQQEPVALFKWLPEGATHIGRISVRTESGGSLAMVAHAFKYDSAVLKVYVTDNDNEYPGWRDAKDCFFHLNFPVLPLYTSPQPAQQEPVAYLVNCTNCGEEKKVERGNRHPWCFCGSDSFDWGNSRDVPAQQEPVAMLPEVDICMRAEAHGIDASTPGLYGFYVDCMSSSPQPAQRKPLTDKQALDALDAAGVAMHERVTCAYELQIFRAAEAAHNIKENT